MISCHALVALLCPFVCSHLNISPFEWYSKCWTSSLVIPICSFHVLLCMVRVLKTVLIGRVNKSMLVLHHFSHSSVKSIVICKSHCNSWCHCSFTKFLWLVLGWNTSGLFSLLSGILCLVTFCFSTVGAIAWLFIWMSSYSTSKGLRRNILFLCPLLVPLPCSFEWSECFMHKTLAYLFLRICWMISSQHLPQFDREDLD